MIFAALVALACGGRTLGDGFEEGVVDPGFGSGGSGSGAAASATGSGAAGSGAAGSGATGSGATGAGGFGATAGAAGAAGSVTAGVPGAGAAGGVAGTGGVGGSFNTCPSPLPVLNPIIHDFESVFAPSYGSGLYVYRDTEYDDTPWSYGYIFPDATDDLSAGLQPGFSGSAFELLGFGFTQGSWGAGFGVYTACIDGSKTRGLRFHVKSNRDVRVSVNTPGNLPVFDGGECVGDYSVCLQNYVDLGPINGGFHYFELTWSSFVGGTPFSIDPSRIVGVGFHAALQGGSFELSIDELAFLY